MNEINKLKLNIDSLFEIVKHDAKFFSPIRIYVNKLKKAMNNKSIDIDELNFLISKVDAFYNKYRPNNKTSGAIISTFMILPLIVSAT